MFNGPRKAYARCDTCGAIDYESNEGDRCVGSTVTEPAEPVFHPSGVAAREYSMATLDS